MLPFMVIRVASFQAGGAKLQKFCLRTNQKKLLNFENWCSREASKNAKI